MSRVRISEWRKNIKDKHIMTFLLPFSFILHQVWNFYIKNPWAMGDELGVMSIAAHFSGYDWRGVLQSIGAENNVNFYGGGFGILFTPLFILIKERPYVLYQAILCICSLFQSVSVIISYHIMNKRFKIENRLFCVLISIGASFFVVSRATNAMNENALILCSWIVTYFIIELSYSISDSKRRLFSLLLAIIFGYAYTTHTRALIFVASAILAMVIYELLFSKRLVIYKIFIPSLVTTFYLVSKFNTLILERMFLLDKSANVYNTGETAMISVFAGAVQFFSEWQWRALGDIFLTNVLGLSVVTINLFLIIFFIWGVVLFKCIRMRIKKQTEEISNDTKMYVILGMVVYLCSFGMLLLYSIHGLGNAIEAIDTGTCTRSHFYLRYPGAFLGPIITMGGIVIWKLKGVEKWKEAVAAILCAMLCHIYTSFSVIPRIAEQGDKQFDFYHYFAPFYAGRYGQEVLAYHFYIMTATILILTIVLFLLIKSKKKVFSACFIMIIIIYQYVYLSYEFDKNQAAEIYNYTYATSEMFYRNKTLYEDIDTIYWPLIGGRWESPYVIQYFLPTVTIKKEIPKQHNDFIMITSKYVGQDVIGKGCYWTILDENTYLYAKGKDVDLLEKIGIEFLEVE